MTTMGRGPSADVSTVLSSERAFPAGSTPNAEEEEEEVRMWPGSMRPEDPWDSREVTPVALVVWNWAALGTVWNWRVVAGVEVSSWV